MDLPNDPPTKAAKTLSATGTSSVLEIRLSYSLPTKNKTCALTKEAMIESILRHKVRFKYKGKLGHDVWRSLREKESVRLPVEGMPPSLRTLVSNYHLRITHVTRLSREQAVWGILCYECLQTLRQACFQTFWQDHQRMPASDNQCQTEIVCAAYLDCSLHRQYASYKGKPALNNDEIRSWETSVMSCCGIQTP